MNDKHINLEIISSSVEEAIAEGLEQLGLTEEAVDIEVLDEGTKGLFGLGSRQARVRLTVKTITGKQDIKAKPSEIQTPVVETQQPTINETDDEVLRAARETVSDLLSKMKIQAEVTTQYGKPDDERSDPPVLIDINGKDLSILIGKKAETLDALQFITKLILGKELEKSIPISLDVEGYRKRREQQIRQLARRVAEQVINTGQSQALEPMPPNERRIVHIELRQESKVFTESNGEGTRRKVFIHPKE